MASQFPSNSDNGKKYYLPSGIFFNDQIPSKFTPHHFHEHPHQHHLRRRRHQVSGIDDLALHFTAVSLLQRQTRFKTPVRTGDGKPRLLPGCCGVNGNGACREHELELRQRLLEYGTGLFSPSLSEPGYDLQFMKPTPAQLDSYLKERADKLFPGMQMQNRFLQQNRNMPFSGSGLGYKGGFVRESGGTGVFHPHPRINISSNTISTDTVARKQSVRDRQEILVTQHTKTTKRPPVASTSKQNHSPSDIRLPKEWTY